MNLRRMTIGTYRGERGRSLAAPRRNRRSRRQVVLRSVAAVGLAAVLAGGVYWALTAPVFAVARVETGRYRFSDEAAVRDVLSRYLGRNIWTLSRGDVATGCNDLPWVRGVRLQRRIPDTIVVELTEWRPLLGVAADADTDAARVLIEDGRVLAAPVHLDAPGLPLLVSCPLERDPGGTWRLGAGEREPLLALIRALEETGLEGTCPVDFIRRTDDGFVLELQGRSGALLLGHDDFRRRLSRYLLAREQIPAGAAVDLRFEDRITFESPAADRS